MKIHFSKYHALGNDFVVVESSANRIVRKRLPELALAVCDRNRGVGADGIVFLSASRRADCKFDIYNADGGWAEMSGNGLRIAGLHLGLTGNGQKKIEFETSGGTATVWVLGKDSDGFGVRGELGAPVFETSSIPVKVRSEYFINAPLKIGPVGLPATCVAVGNPHAVLVVENFDFDWQTLGAEIETARMFPNRTNVEFVRILNRNRITVRSWERGAGPTGSSGTGAAAAVSSLVMQGLVNRSCEVRFEAGSLRIDWDEQTNIISLTGPVHRVMEGTYQFG